MLLSSHVRSGKRQSCCLMHARKSWCPMQSHRSSSNTLRAQDSSDPAFDKPHADPSPKGPDQATPTLHLDPGVGNAPSDAGAAKADTSSKQDAQASTDEEVQEGAKSASELRFSQHGKQEEAEADTAAEEAAHADTDGRTAHLASLAEQADIRQAL